MNNELPFYISYICKEYMLDLQSILNLELVNSKIRTINNLYRDAAIYSSLSKIYKFQKIKLTKNKFNYWYNIFNKIGIIDYIIFITYTNKYISDIIFRIGIKNEYEFNELFKHQIPCRIPLNRDIIYDINQFYYFNNKIIHFASNPKCYLTDICANYELDYFINKYKFSPKYRTSNGYSISIFNIIYLLYNFNFWTHHKLIDYIIPYQVFNLEHYPLFKTELNKSLLIFKKYIIKNYWNHLKLIMVTKDHV